MARSLWNSHVSEEDLVEGRTDLLERDQRLVPAFQVRVSELDDE